MSMLSVLIKPASGNCNLKCKYCFYHALVAKRQLTSRGMMSPETATAIICKIFAEQPSTVMISFQGGEPSLAGLPFFEHFMNCVHEKNTAKIPVLYSFQTNGTLIDDSWCAFFKKNGVLVGLSLDGQADIHDFLRSSNREGTYKAVLASASRLQKHGVDFNILTVVTKHIARHPQAVYNNYKKLGFSYLQFIPCLDDADATESYAPDAELYGDFLCRLYRLWRNDYTRNDYVSIRLFEDIVNKLNGKPAGQCGTEGVCAIQNVIEADGTVYPCDFYCTDSYELGNIKSATFKELSETAVAKRFIDESLTQQDNCAKCQYYPLCKNGCKRERHNDKNIYCTAYQKLFKEMLK